MVLFIINIKIDQFLQIALFQLYFIKNKVEKRKKVPIIKNFFISNFISLFFFLLSSKKYENYKNIPLVLQLRKLQPICHFACLVFLTK